MAITFAVLSINDVLIPGQATKQQASLVTWDAGPTYHVSQTPAFTHQGDEAAVLSFLNANAQFYYNDAVAGNSVIPGGATSGEKMLNRLDWLALVAPVKMGRMCGMSSFNGWSGLTAGEQTGLLNKLNALRTLFYSILKAP